MSESGRGTARKSPPRLDRAYQRFGPWYVAGSLFLLLTVPAGCVAIVFTIFQRYIQLPEATYREVLINSYGVGIPAALLAAAVICMRNRALLDWVLWRGRGEVDPEQVFLQAVTFSRTLSRAMVAAGIGLGGIAFLASVLRAGYTEPSLVVMCVVGPLLTSVFCLVFGQVLFDALLQPLLIEVGSIQGNEAWTPQGHLGPRLLNLVLSFGLLTGIEVAAFSAQPGLGAEAFSKMLLATGALGATTGLLFAVTLTRTLLGPVRALVKGTDRVRDGDFSTRVPPMTDDELGGLVTSFNAMQEGLRERQALHSAMGSYIDPAIAERVMAEGSTISGEAAEVTVMFLDIVGYTAMAEHAQPEEVVSQLNEFFELAIPAIVERGGHANKLLGDGLMAVFGAPESLPDHADRALAAAREIQARLTARYSGDLKAGIGLNSGTVVVGSMGGGPKLDYTIIGDVVNVAARIEAMTRQTGDEILLTDATKELLSSHDGVISRGMHSLKGRATQVEIWAA